MAEKEKAPLDRGFFGDSWFRRPYGAVFSSHNNKTFLVEMAMALGGLLLTT